MIEIEIITWNDIIAYKLSKLDRNTRQNITVWKLLVLDKNTWNHNIVCKWIIIELKKLLDTI